MEQNLCQRGNLTHVNLMIDTVIANLDPSALRSIVHAMLATDKSGEITRSFTSSAQNLLRDDSRRRKVPRLFAQTPLTPRSDSRTRTSAIPTSTYPAYIRKILATLGCGLAFEGLNMLTEVCSQARDVIAEAAPTSTSIFPATGNDLAASVEKCPSDERDTCMFEDGEENEDDELEDAFAEIDSVIVQALTAVQKIVTGNGGARQQLSNDQKAILKGLQRSLEECRHHPTKAGQEPPFERGRLMMEGIARLV